MTDIKDGLPAAAVYDISTAPQPAIKRLPWWQYALLSLAALIFIPLAMIGANTVAHHYIDPPLTAATIQHTHKPTNNTHTPKAAPTPTYDLAGFQSALNGPEAQAFTAALHKLRADDRRYNFAAGVPDAASLINAADSWLSQLQQTKPPPAYLAERVAYVRAIALGKWAAQATQTGLTSANLGLLQKGQALAAQAASALASAPGNAPRGS
jgi:hypothetical protein